MSHMNHSYALIKRESRKQSGGFTFIEVVLVISIILIIAALATPLYTNLQVTSQLSENTTSIMQSMRIAREWSAARLNDTSHGVYFEINVGGDDRYILYQGDTYATRDSSYDRVFVLDSSLSLSTTLLNNKVSFSKGLGIPNTIGDVTLSHEVSGTRSIIINEFGLVEED